MTPEPTFLQDLLLSELQLFLQMEVCCHQVACEMKINRYRRHMPKEWFRWLTEGGFTNAQKELAEAVADEPYVPPWEEDAR